MSHLRIAAIQMDYQPVTRTSVGGWRLDEPLAPADPLTEPPQPDFLLSSLKGQHSLCRDVCDRAMQDCRQTYTTNLSEKVREIMTFCFKLGVDLVVFPEYAVPVAALDAFRPFSTRMAIIAGIGYLQRTDIDTLNELGFDLEGVVRANNAAILLSPEKNCIVTKRYSAGPENISSGSGAGIFKLVLPKGSFTVGVAVCLDFVRERSLLTSGEPHIVAIPAMSRNIDEFVKGVPREFVRVFANHAAFGGTYIGAPSIKGLNFTDMNGALPLDKGIEGIIVVDWDFKHPFAIKPSSTHTTDHRLNARASIVYSGRDFEIARAIQRSDAVLAESVTRIDDLVQLASSTRIALSKIDRRYQLLDESLDALEAGSEILAEDELRALGRHCVLSRSILSIAEWKYLRCVSVAEQLKRLQDRIPQVVVAHYGEYESMARALAKDVRSNLVELRHRRTVASPDQDSSERPAEPGHESVLLNAHSHKLPAQLTPLIGRKQEVLAVCALLQQAEVHLVTLIGTGGVGKTRLSLQIATDLLDAFADGVYFVPLAPISDPDLVVPTIAQTLGLQETRDQSLLDLLKAYLQDKHMLLLLDNFEQVVSAAGEVAALLATCPTLKVLVTSREVLHVQAELEFAVPPLAMPDPKRLPDLVTLSQYEAVALFIERAQAARPEFQLTNANAPVVAEICARLDGLPLAIELAAARSKLLPPQALLARLGQRLQLLTSSTRDVPARQQTLRKTIQWSYDLLTAQEQHLFCRLAVFVGGCTLESVEAVSAALGEATLPVLDGVASLLDKNLLHHAAQEGEELRLLMLETIREFGWEALAESGEREATQAAHAAYYLALAEEAELALGGPQQLLWLERLEREYDNLRAALHWLRLQGSSAGVGGEAAELALRLETALSWFWIVRGYQNDGRRRPRRQFLDLEQALSAQEAVPIPPSIEARQLSAPPARRTPPAPAGLTVREVEVLRLLAQGWTDVQIAEHLVISPRTINRHTTSIYSKIDVSSRSAATRFAIEHHLL